MSSAQETKSSLLRCISSKLFIRNSELRADQGYGVGRTALIKRWKILTPNITGKMVVNGLTLELDWLNGVEFDIEKIRDALRDTIPCSEEENVKYTIEATLFGSQLEATTFYRYFPSEELFKFLFTGTLCITFKLFSSSDLPEKVQIEEEIALSEHQLQQRLNAGESLDDIDRNNRDTGVNMSL